MINFKRKCNLFNSVILMVCSSVIVGCGGSDNDSIRTVTIGTQGYISEYREATQSYIKVLTDGNVEVISNKCLYAPSIGGSTPGGNPQIIFRFLILEKDLEHAKNLWRVQDIWVDENLVLPQETVEIFCDIYPRLPVPRTPA